MQPCHHSSASRAVPTRVTKILSFTLHPSRQRLAVYLGTQVLWRIWGELGTHTSLHTVSLEASGLMKPIQVLPCQQLGSSTAGL